MKSAVVILAGGSGTRFWPVSRKSLPKQFLDLFGQGESLIQATAKRVKDLVDNDSLYVVTNSEQSLIVKEHLPAANLIIEPAAKNTTAAIALAALTLAKIDPNAVMIILPADHHIKNEELLRKYLSQAVEIAAQDDVLVTLGIAPSSANTAYGYIAEGEQYKDEVKRVRRFYEKPSKKRAEDYLKQGTFLWNSGMFIWRAGVILEAIKTYANEIHQKLLQIEPLIGVREKEHELAEIFSTIESISIDFSVLEHAKNVVMITGNNLEWSDVGSWDSWAELLPADEHGNVSMGEVLIVDSRDCIVRSNKRLLAVLGMENLVVVDFENASLICPKDRVQDVKQVVEELKKIGREDLL